MTTNHKETRKEYSIMDFHRDCFNEPKKYNDRHKKMNDELTIVQGNDDFIKYLELEDERFKL